MKTLTTKQCLICNQYEGKTFNTSICQTQQGTTSTKTEERPIKLDFFIALLMKKNISFEVAQGRLNKEELRYSINGVKIRSVIN